MGNSKNVNYTLKQEENDYLLLVDFNQYLNLDKLGRTPSGYTTDASGYTKDGRYINIELKSRNQNLMDDLTISGCTSTGKPYSGKTIYIELHKVGSMLLESVTMGHTPVYINFLNDDVVVLFNLLKLRHKYTTTTRRIWSELYQGFELAKRAELPLSDAFIYKKENNAYKVLYSPK